MLATSVLFTATFSGISIVWDREFGFLREMLVAPVSTTSIIVGKALGGATVATLQSLVILLMAGLVGVPYDPLLMLELVVLLFLMAFLVTCMGLVLAARVKQIQAAMPMVQLVITPLMFLSGALFPLSGLPTWLDVLTRINPMTYAVEPLRAAVFARLDASPTALAMLDRGSTGAAGRYRSGDSCWWCWPARPCCSCWPWRASPGRNDLATSGQLGRPSSTSRSAMMRRWISEVPSKIVVRRASRQ